MDRQLPIGQDDDPANNSDDDNVLVPYDQENEDVDNLEVDLDLDDDFDDEDFDQDSDLEDEEEVQDDSTEDEEEENNDDRENYDHQLPTRHEYLGESVEVSGRTILDDETQEMVILPHPSVILMPGQTLPLTIFRPNVVSAIRTLVTGSKTFGSINIRHTNYRDVIEANVGTTAEIYEYRDPPDEGMEIGFKMKVKGRQRFKVISRRQQIDGTLLAKIKILPEKKLNDPFHEVRLLTCDRLKPPKPSELSSDIDEENSCEGPSRKTSMQEVAGFFSKLTPKCVLSKTDSPPDPTPPRLLTSGKVPRPPLGAFPNWVYDLYDEKVLVQRMQKSLMTLNLFKTSDVKLPSDPEKLSFWIATNLPCDDQHRLRILEMDSAVQRLRYQLNLVKRCQILCCKRCGQPVGSQDDMFSMSQEGPQSAYVNSGGHVHETLTLTKARSLQLVGQASTEFSWFPGYAWTIAQCRNCQSHMGWKFTATSRRLNPKKFWGISRTSVRPLSDAEASEIAEDDLRPIM